MGAPERFESHHDRTACAGATQLSIQVTDGGLKLLQIKDNGCGIHPGDFPILCYRHTTSKLQNHDDLKHISTLGFRGEALCSISFVSRLKIVSMRKGESMGYKAEFQDSRMTTDEPERCAAVQGTCITAEDMFYNVPNRKKSLSSPTQEFRLMYDVIAKYAVFSSGVPCPPHHIFASIPPPCKLRSSRHQPSYVSGVPFQACTGVSSPMPPRAHLHHCGDEESRPRKSKEAHLPC